VSWGTTGEMMVEESAAQQIQVTKPAEQTPIKEQKPKRKKKSAKKVAVVFAKSKRKSSVARASAKAGSGIIRINKMLVDTFEPREIREFILRPVKLSSITRELAKRIDINVNVYGGGFSSQAQAISSAIAKVIAASSDSDTVRKEYMRFDRQLLIDDIRRVESKKFLGPKARARFQTSYR